MDIKEFYYHRKEKLLKHLNEAVYEVIDILDMIKAHEAGADDPDMIMIEEIDSLLKTASMISESNKDKVYS